MSVLQRLATLAAACALGFGLAAVPAASATTQASAAAAVWRYEQTYTSSAACHAAGDAGLDRGDWTGYYCDRWGRNEWALYVRD